MPVTIVVGGQYGSEAKAKAAVHIGKNSVNPVFVRCGGPNAGHTVWIGNKSYVLRLIPSGVVVPDAPLYISAGSMVNLDLLAKEINDLEDMGLEVISRLTIDSEVVIVTPRLIDEEHKAGLGEELGSTQTGTGSTAAARAMRDIDTIGQWFKNEPFMVRGQKIKLVTGVGMLLNNHFRKNGDHVIVEGTQGFGLSLYHSGHYPYCTSKDTTASAFAAEAGIGPRDVTNVVMVIRTYPIRVGGNSGPIDNEISWQTVKDRCRADRDLVEMTSVTKKVRRVGEFDIKRVVTAARYNSATHIMIHGLDYLNWMDRNEDTWVRLSPTSKKFIEMVERVTEVPVAGAFTGPHQDNLVDFGHFNKD